MDDLDDDPIRILQLYGEAEAKVNKQYLKTA